MGKLTALTVEKITAPGMYGDGTGLWLRVRNATAAKIIAGRRKTLRTIPRVPFEGARYSVSLVDDVNYRAASVSKRRYQS
jgi:hypothetical protein